MVADIFETIADVVGSYITVLTASFEGLVEIFYDSTAESITLLGTLALIAVGVGIATFAFNLVKGLFRMR
jgi:hypothetical protein